MPTSRLEAFSDGVLAIIITIMVLELRAPHEPTLAALGELGPMFASYVLSFIYVGLYWNNHHHLLQVTSRIDGLVMWANLHLLFWLSLLPFSTTWMHETGEPPIPVMVYGVNLLGAAVAWQLLQRAIIRVEGPAGPLRRAIGMDLKSWMSILVYVMGIVAAWFEPWVGFGFLALVAVVWAIPDRRMERVLREQDLAEVEAGE